MKISFVRDNKTGGWSSRVDGYLFVLARGFNPTDFHVEQEYMIVSQLGKHPKGWIVEPVTMDHRLVRHEGFECSGSACCTTAYAREAGFTITPGRLNNIIRTADNVNVGWPRPVLAEEVHKYPEDKLTMRDPGATFVATYIVEAEPLVPGECYVKFGEKRLAGVPNMTDLPKDMGKHCRWGLYQ